MRDPSINISQNLDESDELILPYTSQNMIAQISDKNFISASFKSDLDNSKDNEFCIITVEDSMITINIMEIINLCLTDPKNSNVNPYEENINVYQKQGMDNLYYINNIVDYEIFVGIKSEKEEKQNIILSEFSNNKIIPFKYIDEIGSLNINYIKQNKY